MNETHARPKPSSTPESGTGGPLEAAGRAPAFPGSERDVPILGVPISDWTMEEALAWVESLLVAGGGPTHPVFFANAHTLNLACEDPGYREVLCSAERVFGDGTGVRWAARILHGHRLRDNVNGTDLVPELFRRFAGRGFRYYLLGASEAANARAAAHAREAFPGWELAGHHHGYLDDAGSQAAIERINAVKPHLLMVGMGNPLQERWLARHREQLDVRVCMGTGGLFDYWAGDLDRAPAWVRRLGFEWLHLLRRQPAKARRYVLGNPVFLARLIRARWFSR